MDQKNDCRGVGVVMQPGEGDTFWQPRPANGHVEIKFSSANTGHDGVAMGYQTLSPGGHIIKHSHEANVEVLVCVSGTGRAVIDGSEYDVRPGTACFLGHSVEHEIFNEGEDEMVLVWVISPVGQEKYFERIGRPRVRGEPAPPNFDRPAGVVPT